MTAAAFAETPAPLAASSRLSPARIINWVRPLGLHGIWILVWACASWIATLWSPALADHPVVLMLLAPRAVFVVLAAPHMALVPFVLLGTLRLAVTDASWFIVGRRFPDRTGKPSALSRIGGLRWMWRITTQLCKWLCSTGLLAAAVLFFRPNGRYLGIAGAHGVDSRLAGISSVAGTIAYLFAVHLGVASIF